MHCLPLSPTVAGSVRPVTRRTAEEECNASGDRNKHCMGPLEFQSTVDRGMAARVLRYQAMAFEALLRQEEVDADGQLRLLSVVVHSGTGRWTASGAASGVTVSGDGEILCPRPYVLLDTAQAAQDDY